MIEATKEASYEGDHPYCIVYGLKTEESLKNALEKVRDLGYTVYEFREPDRNNELTSFSTSILQERPKEFKKFQLIK